MADEVINGEIMPNVEDTQTELKDALQELKSKIDQLSDQLDNKNKRKIPLSGDTPLDFVTSTAKAAIDDFATRDQSIKIQNITPKYLPFAIDKILELSDDVIIFAGTEDFINSYLSTAIQESAGKKIDIYAVQDKYSNLEVNNVDVHILSPDVVVALQNANIRNAIIGDKIRFLLEKSNEIAGASLSFKQVFDRLWSFKTEQPTLPKQYESLINFHDNFSASKIAESIVSKPITQSLVIS